MDAPADRFGLEGTTLAGRYRVERQIAEGGFAVVYRATQIALDRPVALKVLKTPAGLTGAARARFEERFATEARTIAMLQHPYIVDVYDFGVWQAPSGESAPWMALEWLEGEPLERDLERRRGVRRSVAEAAALLGPVIEAVAYAHRRGVVHRDIKPANIMVVETDGRVMLRMLDFGIAKIMGGDPIGDTRTGRSGAGGFSPDYAAPEQISYSRTGPWTDVHALGLLLTELLTGTPPFSAAADEQLFEQVMSADRPTPGRRGVDAGALEDVLAKALALSPSQRWHDAGELLAAVDDVTRTPRRRPTAAYLQARLRAAVTALQTSPAWRKARDTWRARRPRDLATPMSGAVLVLSVFAALVWGLGSGAGRAGGGHAGARRTRDVAARAATARVVPPWIVPIPACASGASAVAEPPVAARRPSRPPRPAASASAAPLTDERTTDPSCAMSINSVPWSEVWIDGKNTGKHTPFVDVRIDCGAHRIDFKRPDLHIAATESILVKAGETFKRRYTLAGGE